MPNGAPPENKKPIIIMALIEPGTGGDLSFVDKMIESYGDDQPFVVLLNDMGAGEEGKKGLRYDHNMIKAIKDKVGEDNVVIVRSASPKSDDLRESWQLQEKIDQYDPRAIIYGPAILAADTNAANKVAIINNLPFVVVPEYSLAYNYKHSIRTGPGPQSSGIFLNQFEDKNIHANDAEKFGQSLEDLENNNQIFFAYMNDHTEGRGSNPQVFKNELLSYLYLTTSLAANSESQEPAIIFSRITPEIYERYVEELQKNNPHDCAFRINYPGKDPVIIPGKNGDVSDIREINLSNPFPVQKDTMLSMMQACQRQGNPICVTGDQSLSEAISSSAPFIYQTMPWKREVARELQAQAKANGLDGVTRLSNANKVLGFKNMEEAKVFADEYTKNREDWRQDYRDLSAVTNNLHEELPTQVEESISKQSNSTFEYRHANRSHFHEVSPQAFQVMKSEFETLRGDELKAQILAHFKIELLKPQNREELADHVEYLKTTDEYKVLTTGQGVATRAFGLETSSVKEFNRMVDEVARDLPDKSPKP